VTSSSNGDQWQTPSQIVEIRSQWITLVAERLRDNEGREFEYWRIEKSNSLLVVVEYRDLLVLPQPTYRPGVARVTRDLAGGRFDGSLSKRTTAQEILRREFHLTGAVKASITELNKTGWDVDSSTSNQQFYGVVANVDASTEIPSSRIGTSYPATIEGGRSLRDDLTCLQCRATVEAWLDRRTS
jgi:hypothetical protein